MSTVQGNLKNHAGDKIAPNTLTVAVYDAAKEQSLAQTLVNTPDKGALGYPAFSTVTAYTTGTVVYHLNKLWRFTSDHAAGAWNSSHVEEFDIKTLVDELQDHIEDGTVVPPLVENLKSWHERSDQNVESTMTEKVRTTGGDESINADSGATIQSVVATADFAASKLISSGFNLLRLQSNNGLAVALTGGYYFPVPALTFGSYGTADENNGVLFTDNNGDNLKPTVYFKALSAGVPESITDGAACSYVDSNGKRFYVCTEPGYLIVSGITWENTCAHMAWSKRYDEFVSPTAATDAGTILDFSLLGTMRVVGSGAGIISDRADRISATQMRLTTKVGRVQPTWTRGTLDEETGLYPYTATVSAIKSGGLAEFEGSNKPAILVEGTTLTYYSESSTAETAYVKYQLATATTANKNLAPDITNLNDWGVEALIGASGSAIISWTYAQGIPDALVQLLSKIDNSTIPVIAAAFALLNERVADLEKRLTGIFDRIDVFARNVDAEDYLKNGIPMVLYSAESGAPASARIPQNWDQDKMGVWTGVPFNIGQMYVDKVNGKVYVAKALSNSTNDWAVLN